MKALEKIFFHTKMTWKRVLVLSVVCGVVPGLLMLPEFLKDTSFQQPGISYEFWIAAALFIALNCARPVEAGLKTFVFFLISQPLIYLVQVPFSSMGWQLFSYYPLWGILTLFTLPGGMLAWFTRKGNVWAVLLFSVVNFILCVELPGTVLSTVRLFPRYLLAALFILAEIVGFILLLFREKRVRLLAFGLAVGMLLFGSWWILKTGASKELTTGTQLDGEEPFAVVSAPEGTKAEIEGRFLWLTVEGDGEYTVVVEDGDGERTALRLICKDKDGYWEDTEIPLPGK